MRKSLLMQAVGSWSAPGQHHLFSKAASAGLPLLPGAASVSEMMALAEQGYSVQKFFPANAAGGLALLNPYPARCLI